MINESVKVISKKSIQFLSQDADAWKIESYQSDGVYYSNKNQYYFLVFNGVIGSISKASFEGLFHEVNSSPIIGSGGFNEEFFLKTIAMLTGKVSEYKNL